MKKREWAYAIQEENGELYRAYDVQMLYRTKKAAKPNVNNNRDKIVKVELVVVRESAWKGRKSTPCR